MFGTELEPQIYFIDPLDDGVGHSATSHLDQHRYVDPISSQVYTAAQSAEHIGMLR
jgi:hypothetical protein